MTTEHYGYIDNYESVRYFFFESEMTKHLYDIVEYPGLMVALEQEKTLRSMSNRNYRFELTIDRNTNFGSDVVYINLMFNDDITKTEYELLK